MNWKFKARIQNAISFLPSEISYEIYYRMQRNFGGLRQVTPTSRIRAGIETWKRIQDQDRSPLGKVFLEVGTGRAPLVPMAYWLMGAEKTTTIDLNPYLKPKLITDHIRYISQNKDYFLKLFGTLIDNKRFNELISFSKKTKLVLTDFLDLCKIEYIAPGDAAKSNLLDQSIDFHTSYTVFEHIPPDVLKDILKEGNRIIRKNGLFVNNIDYSDHFSQSDKSISRINFLQYSDLEWTTYANNRYMYMNRLRHDDYLTLFENSRQRILKHEPIKDQRAEELLRTNDFILNDRFRLKPKEILAIVGAWIVTEKRE